MQEKTKSIYRKLVWSGVIVIIILLMQPLEIFLFSQDIDILFPSGSIALSQRNLLLFIQVLMLLLIIPVYLFTFLFSWWYRADNKKATYDPHLVDNKYAEMLWWGLPLFLTLIVAAITWVKTYELDPYRPLASDKKPIEIQVVALQWKWLFIYPEEKIATVNYIEIPLNTPIRFKITADAPMNSFWIPKLAGQIYAMPGMTTELNLVANEIGSFRGSSANISGEGFAGMTFTTTSKETEEWKQWIASVKKSTKTLTKESYQSLRKPSSNNPKDAFVLGDEHLFHEIVMSFMEPQK